MSTMPQDQQTQQAQPHAQQVSGVNTAAAQQLAALLRGGTGGLMMPTPNMYSPAALQAAMAAAAMQQQQSQQQSPFPVVPESALSALQNLLSGGSGIPGLPPGFAQAAAASPFAAMLGQQQTPQQAPQAPAQQQQQQQQQVTPSPVAPQQPIQPPQPATPQQPSIASPVSAGEAAAAAAAAVATLSTVPPSLNDLDDSVRKEKVEAALRSKPQRGRKRDNLSAVERQELTRTRNREHAKSTRIRKKARYQELLAVEQRYQVLEAVERQRLERCHNLSEFINVRTMMLRQTTPAPESEEDDDDAITKSDHAQDSDSPSPLDSAEFPTTLRDYVNDLEDFKFAAVSVSPEHQQDRSLSSAARMLRWDQEISRRIRRSWGADGLNGVSLDIVGGADGVAIGRNNSGSCRVNLVLTSHQNKMIMTGMLMFHFANESARLRSVEWCTLNDALTLKSRKRRRAAEYTSSSAASSSATLGYPSFVSLPSNTSSPRAESAAKQDS